MSLRFAQVCRGIYTFSYFLLHSVINKAVVPADMALLTHLIWWITPSCHAGSTQNGAEKCLTFLSDIFVLSNVCKKQDFSPSFLLPWTHCALAKMTLAATLFSSTSWSLSTIVHFIKYYLEFKISRCVLPKSALCDQNISGTVTLPMYFKSTTRNLTNVLPEEL